MAIPAIESGRELVNLSKAVSLHLLTLFAHSHNHYALDQGHSGGARFGSFGGLLPKTQRCILLLFLGSSLFAPRYPFGGTQQCVVCVGEAHQTESCAIPEPGQHCDDEQTQQKNGKPYRDSSRSEFRARPKLRPETKEEREQRNTEDDYGEAGEKEQPPKVAMKDEGMKPKQDVSLDAEDCYWTGKCPFCGFKCKNGFIHRMEWLVSFWRDFQISTL